jgi:hypothetical protein
MVMRIVVGIIIVLAGPAWWLAGAAQAQATAAEQGDEARYTREIIRTFDFNERHGETTPLNWTKVTGRGYPSFTRGEFDTEVYHSPPASFRFNLDGGNCKYEFEFHRTQVSREFDYCLEGWIKTKDLKSSRAALGVWFNDDEGRPVAGSRAWSAAVGGTSDWTRVEVFVSPAADQQGRPFKNPPRFIGFSMEACGGDAADFGAKVWFADLRLYRIPRVGLSLAGGRSFFTQGEAVTARLSADGVLSGAFPGRVVVTDERGRAVWSETATLTADQSGAGRRDVTLSALPPGAYRLSFDAAGDNSTILRRETGFAVVAPWHSAAAVVGEGFGLADAGGTEDPAALAEAARFLGVRTLKVPLWQPSDTAAEVNNAHPEKERLMNALRREGVEFIGVIGSPPECLAKLSTERIRGAADFLACKEDLWQRPLSSLVSRYAGVVSQWQLGSDDDASLVRLQTEPTLLDAASRQIDRLTGNMPRGISWPASYALPLKRPAALGFVSLHLGPEVSPEQIPEYLATATAPGGPRVYLTLEALGRRGHDADGRIADLVSRVLAARRAGVEQIFFHKLTDSETGLMTEGRRPGELFLVARTLCDLLGGSRFAGWLPLEHEATAMVFARPDGSETLVVGKDDLPGPIKEPLYLGENLMQTDVFGNQTAVPRFGSVSTLTLQPMPLYVTGIDPRISGTRQSFALTGGAIPAAYHGHKATIEFTNRFGRGITGTVRLRPPEGWRIDPAVIHLNLAENEHVAQPVTVTVPYNETVGVKDILADFDVEAGITCRFMAVAPVRFEMATARTSAVVYSEGGNLVIEQAITCTAKEPMSYSAYAQIPGRPMMGYDIAKLKPGETVVKRYLLPGSAGFAGKSALLGVRDNTPERGFANVLVSLR